MTARWLVPLLLLACTPESQQDKEALTALRGQLQQAQFAVSAHQNQLDTLQRDEAAVRARVDALRQDETVLKAEKEGRGVHYVLRVSIRQVSYSLSIRKQLRDAVNEESFELPTDKVTYEHTSVGQDLFDSFRAGSAIFHGSLGSWRLRVEDKKIVTD